jgi:hypothetical protein
MTMNAVFQKTSEQTIAAPSTTPEAIAAGRSRPALLGFFALTGGAGVAGAGGVSEGLMAGSELSDLEKL